MKTQLEIGDNITVRQYNSIQEIISVTRVTAKRAYCLSKNGNYENEFYRDLGGRGVRLIGRASYGPTHSLTTQADLDFVALKAAKSEVEARFNLVKSKLSIGDCEALMNILNAIQ